MDRYNAYNDPNDDGTVIVDPVTGLQTINMIKYFEKGLLDSIEIFIKHHQTLE